MPGVTLPIATSLAGTVGGAELTTDASGHFEVSLKIGSLFALQPTETGYFAPCPPNLDRVTEATRVDIHLVPYAVLTSTGTPASLPTWHPKLSGKVFDGYYDSGVLVRESPVTGVIVGLSDEKGGVLRSVTVSDTRGRFVLCTPPAAGVGQVAWVSTMRDGVTVWNPWAIAGDDTLAFDVGAAPGYWDY